MAVNWTAGGNLNTSRYAHAGFGTLTAGAVVCKVGANSTEEYDGASWSNGNNAATTSYFLGSAGTQTAGIKFAGTGGATVTEEYDGTDWSAGGTFPVSATVSSGCGTLTAGLSAGEFVGGYTTNSHEYDGTNWAAGGNLNTARNYSALLGLQTSGLVVTGENVGDQQYTNTSEEYDGSSWTSGGNVNVAGRFLAAGGTQTNAMKCFGQKTGTTYAANVETYDGASWSNDSDATSQGWAPGSDKANASTGFIAGGYTGSVLTTTSEYSLEAATTTSTSSTSTSTSSSTSSTSTSTSTSSSSSTSTTLDPSIGGLAFGEETPTNGETEVSWATWGGTGSIVGDADWGKLALDLSEYGYSRVYSFGDETSRTLTVYENRYGTGQGAGGTIQIRGQSTSFAVDAETPEWENYTVPVAKTWQFIQVRVIKNA